MGIFQSNSNSIYNQDIKSTNKIRDDYFNLIHKQQRIALKTNSRKSTNIYLSLIEKSFEEVPTVNRTYGFQPKKKRIKWKDYLINYLKDQLIENNNWARLVLQYIQSEIFMYSHEFKSSFFYREFELNTKPKCLSSNRNSKNKYSNTNQKEDRIDMGSLTDSLGGSFISSNTDLLLPNDPSIEYKAIRNMVKSYISIFKEHIFDTEHPINKIATKFVEVISYEMQTKLETATEFVKSSYSEIELSRVNNAKTSADNFIQIIQGFILHIQTALKLLYAQTLNYDCMREEKDEFVNLISCLLFQVKNGQLYYDLFEYYKITFNNKIVQFEEKLKEMNQITLYELGIKEQFRLDDSTLKYLTFLIKDKANHLPNDKDNTALKQHLNELEEKISQNQFQKNHFQKEKDKDKDKDANDDSYINDEYQELSYFGNYNKQDNPKQEINFRLRLGSLNEENSINVTTSRTQTLNDRINTNSNCNSKGNGINLNQPYNSAIELFKSIGNYTIPFQKMLILANLSIEITKCINEYWEGMEKVIPPDLLNIDADELLTIFIYIIIKGNISEILIHQQFISDFTTAITKRTMLGYYYTTVESALIYLNNTKSKQALCDKRRRSSAIPDRSSFINEF